MHFWKMNERAKHSFIVRKWHNLILITKYGDVIKKMIGIVDSDSDIYLLHNKILMDC